MGRNLVIMMSDIHRDIQAVKKQIEKIGKENIDMLLSLGDDSLNYFGGNKDRARKGEINSIGVEMLLLRGNHDKRAERIKSYKERVYKGGVVYYEDEYPNLNFAKSGEIYNIKDHTGENQRVLVISGGYSIDKYIRKEMGIPYFEDELPTEVEKSKVESQISTERIDYILSHVAPLRYEPTELFLPYYAQSTVDKSLEVWLDKLYDKVEVKKWYFGHYHGEKVIDNVRLVYKTAIEFGR